MDPLQYTVGWIAPLALELTAASQLLDEQDEIRIGTSLYKVGKIGPHCVVMDVQPTIGTNSATDLARNMKHDFKNLTFFLVVGIGGGVPCYGTPGAKSHIALGDVVVSSPRSKHGGVVPYDRGAWTDGGKLEYGGHLNKPPHFLLSIVHKLNAKYSEAGFISRIPAFIQDIRHKVTSAESEKFKDPGEAADKLFADDYLHPSSGQDCANVCDLSKAKSRQDRHKDAHRLPDTPKIHYGLIGSSDQLQISSAKRNECLEEHGVICFEMEGAGVIDQHACLIVRGICDYSDSHKNNTWQRYAAATAAAYAKELLLMVPSADVGKTNFSECLKSLYWTDPRDDKKTIEINKGGLLPDAYLWILNVPEFTEWRGRGQNRLLWMKSDPGKGKTMLLCGIIDELNSDEDGRLLSYFFCKATEPKNNNATDVLRGLIWLLVTEQPPLISHVWGKYDQSKGMVFESGNAWVALCEIFTNILQDPHLQSTYLIIDALDECVADLPKLLDLIVQKSAMSSPVKWLISSRNKWPIIDEQLELAEHKITLSLETKAESVSLAVDAYIQYNVNKLARLKKYREVTKTKVLDYLSSNANNTFLWVALVCQKLKLVTSLSTLKTLHSFPPGLDNLYDRMLQQVHDSDESDLCKQILATVTVAQRPISLAELVALTEIPDDISSDAELLEQIIMLCGSFLDLQQSTIHFVHFSAKEFLLKRTSSVFSSGVEQRHSIMFAKSIENMSTLKRDMHRLCDTYGVHAFGFHVDKVSERDLKLLTLSKYSCEYWIDHLCEWQCNTGAVNESDIEYYQVGKFLESKFLYWLEALSLLRSMSQGMYSLIKLKAFLQVSIMNCALQSLKLPNFFLGKSKCISVTRTSSRCSPLSSVP